jgi:redox-sensitive bicupin YhaK (pirin superfamily)
MPIVQTGMMQGMQLWVNLPSTYKMTAPRYRGITSQEIPVIKMDGLEIKVIAGTYGNKKGPVKDLIVDIEYLDVLLEKDKIITFDIIKDYTTFCYLIEGKGVFEGSTVEKSQMILINDTAKLSVKANEDLRFLFVSGKPVNEPIAWGGPIVMNTQEEIQIAFNELDNGTFIKQRDKVI